MAKFGALPFKQQALKLTFEIKFLDEIYYCIK